MGHLGELRKRLTYIAIVVVVCIIVPSSRRTGSWIVLMRPLKNTSWQVTELAAFGATEGFMQVSRSPCTPDSSSALPYMLYQFWAFIMPALYENEKRSVVPYVAFTTGLFLAGMAFAYFIVLPVGAEVPGRLRWRAVQPADAG